MSPPIAIDVESVTDTQAIVIPDPILDKIIARRAKAGNLVAGAAAASNSDMFKAPVRPPHE